MAKRWRRPGRRVLIGRDIRRGGRGRRSRRALSTQGGGSTAGASIAPNAVGVIDSESGKIVSEISVGGSPGEIAVRPDAVWVTNANDNTVSRIDSTTNQVVQTIRVGGGPAGVAVGGKAVWVANGLDGTVSRIDPTTNQVVQTITVGNGPKCRLRRGRRLGDQLRGRHRVPDRSRSGSGDEDGPGGHRRLGRRNWLRPRLGRISVVRDCRRPGSSLGSRSEANRRGWRAEHAVAAGADAVWVANRADGTVSKIDPTAAAVTAHHSGRRRAGRHRGGRRERLGSQRGRGDFFADRSLDRRDREDGPARQPTARCRSHAAGRLRRGSIDRERAPGRNATGPGHLWSELHRPHAGAPARRLVDPDHDERRTRRVPAGRRCPGRTARAESRRLAPTPTDSGKTYTFPGAPGNPLFEREARAAGRFQAGDRAYLRSRPVCRHRVLQRDRRR